MEKKFNRQLVKHPKHSFLQTVIRAKRIYKHGLCDATGEILGSALKKKKKKTII